MTAALVSLSRTVRIPTVALCLAAALAACAEDAHQPLAPTGRASRTTVVGAVSVSPGSIQFPSVIYHQTYVDTVKINNAGDTPVDVSSYSMVGNNPLDFSLMSFGNAGSAPECGYVLQPHTTCLVGVAFNPAAAGQRSASLNISTSLGLLSVNLAGQGLIGELGVSTTSVWFGDQDLYTPTVKYVTIKNTGTADLKVTKISVSGDNAGDFSVGSPPNNPCILYVVIVPGGSCDIAVRFTPTAGGARTASAIVETTSYGMLIGTATIDLAGNGIVVPPRADLSLNMSASLSSRTLTYFIGMKNYGPNAATGVVLRDTLPSGTTLVGVTAPSDVVCKAASTAGKTIVSCSVDALAFEDARLLQIVVNVGPSVKGSITNYIYVSSAVRDPILTNNYHVVTTAIPKK